MKKFNLFSLLFLFSVIVFAEAPKGYYDSAEGKTNNNLRLALQDIIDGHTVVSYDNLNMLYIASDSHPDGSLWDMYSTCSWQHNQKKCGNYKTVCDCYNKEHSIPQSWFNKAKPMYSDAFHVYPTDGKVNGQRSNYPFGECTGGKTLTADALGRLGTSTFSGFSGTVFEPVDDYKGDFARTYFYMATRYADKCSGWGNQTFGTASNGLTTAAVNLFLKWHRQDPVSEKERVRNDAIYGINNTTGYKQGNRNPFIDYPELAEFIWGTKQGQSWYQTSTPIEQVTFSNLHIYPNPASQVISVTTDDVIEKFVYTIFAVSGQKLLCGTAQPNDLISIEHLNEGVYLLQIDANAKKQVMKLVVTK